MNIIDVVDDDGDADTRSKCLRMKDKGAVIYCCRHHSVGVDSCKVMSMNWIIFDRFQCVVVPVG